MSSVLEMMAMGSFLAGKLKSRDDAALQRFIAAQFPAEPKRLRNGAIVTCEWACAWHDNGFPRVSLGPMHAASLMSTNTRAESIPDARAPWDAFLVDVPDGLVAAFGRPVTLVSVRVGRAFVVSGYPKLASNVTVEYGDERGFFGTSGHDIDAPDYTSGYLVADNIADLGGYDAEDDPDKYLLARLVLGVCMEMTSTTYKGERLGPRPVKRDPRTGEPKAWTFALTRDVKVDCRDAVRAYSRGETHNSPSVQCLVRGHWKTQPCGKGGADRKNIFVEPYWRGPEEAHIALRKHVKPDAPNSPEAAS